MEAPSLGGVLTHYFSVSREFQCNGDSLWEMVIDIPNITKYWRGFREVQPIGDELFRVRFAFPASGVVRIVPDHQNRTLVIEYLKGPFRGKNRVIVEDRKIVSNWEVEFNGFYKLMAKRNVEHFRSGAQHALDRLVEECSFRSQHSPG